MKNISTLLWLGIATYMPSSFAFAQDAVQQKIREPIAEAVANPEKEEDKLTIEYDFVQNITRVHGRPVYFPVGKKINTNKGDYYEYTHLSFSYIYDGEQPKKPTVVMVRIYMKGSFAYPFDTCYWRCGDSIINFDINSNFQPDKNSVGMSSVTAYALLPLHTFLNWSKMPELYMKLDDKNIVYYIGPDFMAAIKEVADSIPKTGETSNVAPPEQEKKK